MVSAVVLGSAVSPVNSAAAGVAGQVVDVGDPPGRGELEREQGQQVGDRGDVAGAGVSGRVDEAGQVQGEQVGQGEQQPGQPGRVAAGELAGDVGVVLVGQGTGPGQVFAAGPAAGGVAGGARSAAARPR